MAVIKIEGDLVKYRKGEEWLSVTVKTENRKITLQVYSDFLEENTSTFAAQLREAADKLEAFVERAFRRKPGNSLEEELLGGQQ